MEVTKLSSDKSEILVQLYDSLEDVLEKGNELDKKILEQMGAFNKVENELSDLDKRFDNLKSKNVDNLTTNGAKDAGDIVRKIISKKKEKQDLLDVDQVLYKEYMIITNEIKKIQNDIDNVLNEEEIETLSTNSGIKVGSLNTVVHIKHTDFNYIILEPISIENSEISETTLNIVSEISRNFRSSEEDIIENDNPHELLINLYNSRNRQKEEQDEFLSRVPKFIEKNDEEKSEKLDSQQDNIPLPEEEMSNESKLIDLDNSMGDNITTLNLDVETNENNTNDQQDDLELTDLNIEDSTVDEENKIVGMPDLDLPTPNLTKAPNIETTIPETQIPTFEVPVPNITVSSEQNVDVNNNIPLNEDEVNSILSGNNIEEPIKREEVSEVIVKEPLVLSKIANSTEAKVQTILGVWSKYKAPKTVIKNDIKKAENVVPLDAILSGSDNSENNTPNNIQSFFSNAA